MELSSNYPTICGVETTNQEHRNLPSLDENAQSFYNSISLDKPLPFLLTFDLWESISKSSTGQLRIGCSLPDCSVVDIDKERNGNPKCDQYWTEHQPNVRYNILRMYQYGRLPPPEKLRHGLEFTLGHQDIRVEESENMSHLRACQFENFYDPESGSYCKEKMSKSFNLPQKVALGGQKFASQLKRGSGKANQTFSHYHKTKFYSQPSPNMLESDASADVMHQFGPFPNSFTHTMEYSIFKTKSTVFERTFSRLYSRDSHTMKQDGPSQSDLNARRYFSALQGPELDILRDSEDTVLSVDKKWPFLLRFPIGCFGICLGLGSQTILWKTMSTAATMHFLHVPPFINLVLWCLALLIFITVFTIYSLKSVFYFGAVQREFYHPVRVNFFFAPWIACMFLTLGVPPAVTESIHPITWALFMSPIFVLELKIYGQWLSGGARRLSQVANPSTHLSLVGNFVGALLAATVGLKELAIFFWAVGLAHYAVLFVTLYQRLPTAAVLPKELHPVFFLFVAAPSTASVAWSKIVGEFDMVSRIAYFVGLFLYSSLVVRINFFRGFRFSVAWWAYTFPMTASAIATIHYSLKVEHPLTQGLAVALSLISTATVMFLCVFTLLHIFVWRTMFPNDVAIAITNENHSVRSRGEAGSDRRRLGGMPQKGKRKA